MRSLDRILVAVDFGPNTEAVVETAGSLAASTGAAVRPLFVVDEISQPPEAIDLLVDGARERMGSIQSRFGERGVDCEEPIQVAGKPFDTIVRTADRVDARLIVIGRGRACEGGHSGLGTTTSRVMRRTAHPVLAVAPGVSGKMSRILCPVDGSSASARGLRNAIQLAQKLAARLTVMTVLVELAPVGVGRQFSSMAKVATEYEAMEREQFEKFITGFAFEGVTWDKEIHYGHPADEIVKLATSAKYDLVVMGSTGRSGLPRVLLGSTAETVARRVPCSVLTVKREDVLSARLEADIAEFNRLMAEGNRLLEEGRMEEAINQFDQCLLKDSFFPPAIEGLASAYERLGRAEQAADLREQAALVRRELWHQHQPSESALS